MLIKFKNSFVNLNNIWKVNLALLESGWAVKFAAFEGEEGEAFFICESEEEASKVIEKILDAYRWERKICDLDQESENKKYCKVCKTKITGDLDVCTGCY